MILWSVARAANVFIIAVALLVPAVARALSPAEASFQEGRRLMAAGQTDAACARFAESFTLVASSGTLLNLALCHERQGKTATAWNEYRAAARLAHNQGREDRVTVADAKAAELEPKLARLKATAATPAPGLEVSTEDGVLGEGGLGVAVPVDPGTHQLIANAPGFLDWRTTIEVKTSEERTVEIPALQPKLVPAPAPPSVVTARLADSAPATRRSTLDLYLAGGGAVPLVAGTVVWTVAYAKYQSALDACNQGAGCTDRDSRVSTINALQVVAITSWIAGGALVVVAGLHYAFRRTRPPMTVAVDPMSGGVGVAGAF